MQPKRQRAAPKPPRTRKRATDEKPRGRAREHPNPHGLEFEEVIRRLVATPPSKKT